MFTFKQFHINDSRCGMKVGTDAVSLGAWMETVARPSRILDVGTGCGILSLMAAQRFPDAHVCGVEADAGAASDARYNVAASKWSDRMEIIEGDIFKLDFQDHFDLIVSNPPFFTETLRSPDSVRAGSRHEGALGVDSLITLAARLLTDDGNLCFIAPAGRLDSILFSLSMARLEPRRIAMLSKRRGAAPVRVLIDASRRQCAVERAELIIDSDEYRALTKDFYLDNASR